MKRFAVPWIFAALALAACESRGVSAREMERAAIDRARQELKLDADVPLEARVWVGKPVDGDVSFCGTVSSPGQAPSPIIPQRFLARSDPLKFEVFEPAHDRMVVSQPEKFQSWVGHCEGEQPA